MANATQQEVDRVIAAYENAKKAMEFAGSLVLEMQQNSGDDYTMVWTENSADQAE